MVYLNGEKVSMGSKVTIANLPVDQEYNPESEKAQIGKAVAQALKTVTVDGVEYELTNTITVKPDIDGRLPQQVNFTLDKDGKPFELKSFYVNIAAGFTDGSTSTLYANINDVLVLMAAQVNFTNNTLRRTCLRFRKLFDGFIDCNVSYSASHTVTTYWNGQADIARQLFIPPSNTKTFEPITKVSLYTLVGTDKTWIDGSRFELWGVRK